MRMSDLITQEIIKMLNESGVNTAEIQRNEFANTIGCAPSQINYVLSSRFTPEHGYMIESRRGGGGYKNKACCYEPYLCSYAHYKFYRRRGRPHDDENYS